MQNNYQPHQAATVAGFYAATANHHRGFADGSQHAPFDPYSHLYPFTPPTIVGDTNRSLAANGHHIQIETTGQPFVHELFGQLTNPHHQLSAQIPYRTNYHQQHPVPNSSSYLTGSDQEDHTAATEARSTTVRAYSAVEVPHYAWLQEKRTGKNKTKHVFAGSKAPAAAKRRSSASTSGDSTYRINVEPFQQLSSPARVAIVVEDKKKERMTYSRTQQLEMEKEFRTTEYLKQNRRRELATLLGLNERQIKIWFQNRRMKEKRRKKDIERAQKAENGEKYGSGDSTISECMDTLSAATNETQTTPIPSNVDERWLPPSRATSYAQSSTTSPSTPSTTSPIRSSVTDHSSLFTQHRQSQMLLPVAPAVETDSKLNIVVTSASSVDTSPVLVALQRTVDSNIADAEQVDTTSLQRYLRSTVHTSS